MHSGKDDMKRTKVAVNIRINIYPERQIELYKLVARKVKLRFLVISEFYAHFKASWHRTLIFCQFGMCTQLLLPKPPVMKEVEIMNCERACNGRISKLQCDFE